MLAIAALGLVGASTISAQVYSVNVVGYSNASVAPGFNLLANPLDNKTGNNLANLFPTPPDGLQIFLYRSGAYEVVNYDSMFGGWDPATAATGTILAPGEGYWLNWPNAASTLTFVGDVMQGTLNNTLPAGYSIRGSMVPQAGKLVTDLGFPIGDGDVIFTFVGGAYQVYNYDSMFGGWDPKEPEVAVGQGFWALKQAAATWTRTFTVQ